MTILEQRFMTLVPDMLGSISKSLASIDKKMPEKQAQHVWVFTAEQAWGGETEETIVRVFATEEAAHKHMQEFLHDDGDESILQYVERKGWETELNEPKLYRAFKDGYYSTDHIEITITECEIKK